MFVCFFLFIIAKVFLCLVLYRSNHPSTTHHCLSSAGFVGGKGCKRDPKLVKYILTLSLRSEASLHRWLCLVVVLYSAACVGVSGLSSWFSSGSSWATACAIWVWSESLLMARSFPDAIYSQDGLTHLEVKRVVSSEYGAKCFDSIGIKDSIG